MPRNASGDYSLPAGNPVVTGTTIDSSWANDTMNDIATAITDSLSRSGDGGMLVALTFADGTVGAPGIGWVSEPTTGFYRAATNDMRAVVAGADRARFRADATNPLQIWSGGAWVNPNLSQEPAWETKVVTASESNNTTTLAASAYLTGFALAAATTYEFEAYLSVISSGGGDIKFDLSFNNAPQSSFGSAEVVQGTLGTFGDYWWSALTSALNVDIYIGNANQVILKGVIRSNASLASTMVFRFAQNTLAAANPAFVGTNSYMKIRKIA